MSVQPTQPPLHQQMREAIRLRHEDVAAQLFTRFYDDYDKIVRGSAKDFHLAALAYRIMDQPHQANGLMERAKNCADFRFSDAADSLIEQALACANEERYSEARRLLDQAEGYATVYDLARFAACEVIRARIALYQKNTQSLEILERLQAELSDKVDEDPDARPALDEVNWWLILAACRLGFALTADQTIRQFVSAKADLPDEYRTRTEKYRLKWASRLDEYRPLRRFLAVHLISKERGT